MSNFSLLSDYFKTVCICTQTLGWDNDVKTTFSERNSIKQAPLKCEFVMFPRDKEESAAFCVFYYFHTRGYKLMIQLYSMLTLRATKYSKSLASLCF